MTARFPRATRSAAITLAVAVALIGSLAGSTPHQHVEASSSSGFTSITPKRVVDTRQDLGARTFGPTATQRISLAGIVPSGATAVALNVTATSPTQSTFLTVWPGGQSRPPSSNVNVSKGVTRPNAVLVGLRADRTISVYNQNGRVDVVIDVTGYFTDGFEGIRPTRVMDTRRNLAGATFGAGATRSVRVAGTGAVPSTASAVAVNVTATNASRRTFMTVWPTGTSRPNVSNLNVAAGATVPNLVVVGVGSQGRISLYNQHGSVDGIVDVMGWFDADGGFRPVRPSRRLDTRTGACGVRLGPGETRRVDLGLAGASAATLNVTAVGATRQTYLTLWPAGSSKPLASSLNVPPGQPTPNLVVIGAGVGGQIDVYNHAGHVDVVIDVFGEFAGQAPPGARAGCPSRGTSSPAAPATTSPPRAVPSAPSPTASPATTTPSTTGPGNAPPPTTQPSTTPPPQPGGGGGMLASINSLRAAAGVGPLAMCGTLTSAAQNYAVVLQSWGRISHTGPNGSTMSDRVTAAGYVGWNWVGENLAAGQPDVAAVMTAWMNSPGHRANILRPEYTHVGLGQAGTSYPIYWVQNFGRGGTC